MKQTTPAGLRFLDDALRDARERDLLRIRPAALDGAALSFCSNDYLGLANELAGPEAAGAGSARLVAGERAIHAELEREAAALVGLPAALVFTSGYAANVGTLAALAGPGDLIVSDALNHASLIDGARLSRAQVVVTPHLELGAVEDALRRTPCRRAFVVTESYFSMDADGPDLRQLRRICDHAGAALYVDEAHALGVLGPDGRGLSAEAGVVPDVLVGTFGKAYGAGGAFVAGCESLGSWLWNRARSFVFSTGLSPVLAAAALAGLRRATREPERRQRVAERAAELRRGLAALGVRAAGHGYIVPWILGEARAALQTSSLLRTRGLDVRAIRPPTVPEGTSRLRMTVTARHAPEDIQRALSAIAQAAEALACPAA